MRARSANPLAQHRCPCVPEHAAPMVRPAVRVLGAMLLVLACTAPTYAQEVIEYYGTDHLGSVRVVFDAAGNVISRADYLPFGEEVFAPTGSMPAQQFTGQARDGEAGQDYFHARMYQPRTGRFNAADPIYAGLFDPQQWNRFAYARNNPLKFVDPLGAEIMCFVVFESEPGLNGDGFQTVESEVCHEFPGTGFNPFGAGNYPGNGNSGTIGSGNDDSSDNSDNDDSINTNTDDLLETKNGKKDDCGVSWSWGVSWGGGMLLGTGGGFTLNFLGGEFDSVSLLSATSVGVFAWGGVGVGGTWNDEPPSTGTSFQFDLALKKLGISGQFHGSDLQSVGASVGPGIPLPAAYVSRVKNETYFQLAPCRARGN